MLSWLRRKLGVSGHWSLADYAKQREERGEEFSLRAFFDALNATDSIPIALSRWEMTGLGDEIVAIALAVFALTTILGWSFYGERCWNFLAGPRSILPFRGVVREVTGAAVNERLLRAAYTAGMARRAFLKGWGLGRGCAYPARPKVLAPSGN